MLPEGLSGKIENLQKDVEEVFGALLGDLDGNPGMLARIKTLEMEVNEVRDQFRSEQNRKRDRQWSMLVMFGGSLLALVSNMLLVWWKLK